MSEPEQPRRGILERYPAWLLILLLWFVGIPLLILVVVIVVGTLGALL